MPFENVFRPENIDLLFRDTNNKDDFIAYADDYFSEYLNKDEFSLNWSRQFESGRYVIIIFQRYSVFEDGKPIYRNADFLGIVGSECRYTNPHYVVVSDTARHYYISSWKKNLSSHILHSKEDPLQLLTFTDIKKAEKTALSYSLDGHHSAVLEWFEDYDMY